MRVAILGGTRFIGRRITERLVERGDEVLVVHRGLGEPEDWVPCQHLHTERADFVRVADRVRAFAPDGVIDTLAMSEADCTAVLPYLPDVPLVVLSSMDVYEACASVLTGPGGFAVPLTERSSVRSSRYPYRGQDVRGPEGYAFDLHRYDKLDVEPHYLARGGAVLRLSMVYGAHDPQLREEFVLRRVRAGRRAIPVGAGNLLWTRVGVDDVARAALAALDTPAARGEIINIGEAQTFGFRDWMQRILDAVGSGAELVRVADADLPPDLALSAAPGQHLLFDSSKAARLLGWSAGDPAESIARSARWPFDHPPAAAAADFAADDHALTRSAEPSP